MGFFTADTLPMLEIFQSETAELMAEFSARLLQGEKDGSLSPQGLGQVFRAVHTIKSAAAVMGLEAMRACTHQLEDLLQFFRETPEALAAHASALFPLLYAYQDYILSELARTGEADFQPAGAESLQQAIGQLLDAVRARELRLRVWFKPDCMMEGVRAEMLLQRIRPLCRSLEAVPGDLDAADAELRIRRSGLLLTLTSAQPDRVLEKLRAFRYTAELESLQDIAPETPDAPTAVSAAQEDSALDPEAALDTPEAEAAAEAPETPKPVARETTPPEDRQASRCSVSRRDVETLQDLLAELIALDASLQSLSLQHSGLQSLEELSLLHRGLLEQLDQTVTRMSMASLSGAAQQLYRTVREICRQEGKLARLEIRGEETRVDRSLIDQLTPALIHLVRNAVDHGIETPDRRLAAGKPETGSVTLDISVSGGLLTLRLSDDGAGIDRAAVLSIAGRRGLLTKAPEQYEDAELFQLLLEPGFSTTAEANAYSGRGVGLDVVQGMADLLGGALRIDSRPGAGSSFYLQVPVNATAVDSLVFHAGGQIYLLPVRSILRVESLLQAQEDFMEVGGRRLFGPDAPMPVLCLASQAELDTPAQATVLVIRSLHQHLAVIAGAVEGQATVVEKPLPAPFDARYKNATGIQGCCVLGDGRVGLMLNAEKLIALQRKEEMS